MKSHIETLCVVGIVLLGLLMHQQMRKRIERLENQLGLMRVTYIHTTNGIAEITTGFTISQASNLYNAVKKVQTEPEGLRFKSWEESKIERIKRDYEQEIRSAKNSIALGYTACRLGLNLSNYLAEYEAGMAVSLSNRINEAKEDKP